MYNITVRLVTSSGTVVLASTSNWHGGTAVAQSSAQSLRAVCINSGTAVNVLECGTW
jgi:hypothetical protein